MTTEHKLGRREFLRQCASWGMGAFALAHGPTLFRTTAAWAKTAADALASPIQLLTGAFASQDFNGDDVTRPHDILWNLEAYLQSKGGRPPVSESVPVVVVGGGVSGLLSAYYLRDLGPVLLEQAPAFGGNSKGEKIGEETFAIGAAYIAKPDPGDEVDALLRDLGLASLARREDSTEQKVLFRTTGLRRFWEGDTDPGAREAFAAVNAELTRVARSGYPDIPWSPDGHLSLAEYTALDHLTAADWLRQKLPNLHPHVEEYFQVYCWSSLGGSLDEISAAHFLNFAAAECDGVVVLPGGNAAISEAIFRRLQRNPANLRPGCMALEVKNVPEGVEILYEDAAGVLRVIRAGAAVVAAPKYVARYIVKGLEPARDRFWKDLPYRAYVVINVMLDRKLPSAGFDIFGLEGKAPERPTFGARTDRPWTDFVYAGWADHGEGSVLTLYKPYPFEGSRPLISGPIAHGRIRAEVEKELPKTLTALGAGEANILGIRLTRWGHSIPLARAGELSAGQELLAGNLGRVFFANQDNFLSPAFESCLTAAREAEMSLRKLFRQRGNVQG